MRINEDGMCKTQKVEHEKVRRSGRCKLEVLALEGILQG
jgi:hypothetical protein